MIGWNKISLYKYQQIDLINNKPIDDIGKMLFATCIVFNKTEFELDKIPLKKVEKMSAKVEQIFLKPMNQKAPKRIGKYLVNYDASKITFGQYVELSFFLQQPIQFAHYILASISKTFVKTDHPKRASYFQKRPVEKVMGAINKFLESYSALNKRFAGLFGLDEEVHGAAGTDRFIKRYGWTYAVSQVAEYNRITLEEAYKLPVVMALNNLSYLKEKSRFEADQIKKK